MTYYELIKKTLGENATTEKLMTYLVKNTTGFIKAFVTGVSDEAIKAMRIGYSKVGAPDLADSDSLVNEMVGYLFGSLDLMTIPNDGKTHIFEKAGVTLAEILVMNDELFKKITKEEEPAVSEAKTEEVTENE